MNLPVLYQLPISHYCEKVRWAMDYKQIRYNVVNLLPGPHAARAKKLTGATHLPILQHGDTVLNESSDILAYLDTAFPAHPLLPADASLHPEILEWEAFADKHIGPHVRRVCYYTVLEHKPLCVSYLSGQGPWYGRFLVSLIYPKLKGLMQKSMNITDAEVTRSERAIDDALNRIHNCLRDRNYLVGDGFSRADLAVSALLAPICQPDAYPVDWMLPVPPPLANVQQKLEPRLRFVVANYQQYRGFPVQ